MLYNEKDESPRSTNLWQIGSVGVCGAAVIKKFVTFNVLTTSIIITLRNEKKTDQNIAHFALKKASHLKSS